MSSVISYDFIMDNNKIQLIGAPCGHHGPYTFYKAFKYNKNGKCRILALSDFFFVKLWSDSDLMSIGELQLLWMDKNSEQVLASLRLYFLPENTPEGRSDDHGEDEVLAISEKVVLRAADLLERIITEEARWERGLSAVYQPGCPPPQPPLLVSRSALDFQDVNREKQALGSPDEEECAVVVLSFPRYCRYRGILKRLEGVAGQWLHNALVVALGGFAVPRRNTRVLFCKDTFDYPDLEGHELLCNHLAPNLKGRPRRKRKKRSLSPGGSESNESESSLSTVSSSATRGRPGVRNGIADPGRALAVTRRSGRLASSPEERDFLAKLHSFMRMRDTPISRVPHLGFKEIDLFAFFTKVQKLGGYSAVTANKMWKPIYDELGGDQGNTSAATYTRRHYERLLLPYEKSVKEAPGKQANNRQLVKLKAIKPAEKKEVTAVQNKQADTKNAITNGNRSDKAAADVKSSTLRNTRPKSEKSQDASGTTTSTSEPAPQGKENIPVPNKPERLATDAKSEQPNKAAEPEIIDLVSDQDSPVKIGKTPVPALKKRKLEILKEGGLEVTAISSGIPEATVGSITIVPERRPSVIQHAAPVPSAENQVSITVTPDVSHMIEMASSPNTDTASTPSPSPNFESAGTATGSTGSLNSHRYLPELKIPSVQNLYGSMSSPPPAPSSAHSSSSCDSWTPPKVVQSRSIYARSETVVYGDPKDEIEHPKYYVPGRVPQRPLIPTEVLDLRKKGSEKPIVTVSRIPSAEPPFAGLTTQSRPAPKPSNGPQFSVIGGRHIVGSNLEITVVDVPKSPAQPQPRQTGQRSTQSHKKGASQKSTSSKTNSKSENSRQSSAGDSHRRNSSSTFNAAQLIIPNPYLSSTANGRKNIAEQARVRLQQQNQQQQQQQQQPSQQNHHQQQPQQTQQQHSVRQQHKKNVSSSEDSVPYLPPSVAGYPPQAESVSSSTAKSPPYLPIVDPLYYQSVFGGRTPALFSAGLLPRVQTSASSPVFAPTAEQLQLYKELVNHHGGLSLSQQIAATGNFLGLLRDGSTSITPVSPTQFPTFK